MLILECIIEDVHLVSEECVIEDTVKEICSSIVNAWNWEYRPLAIFHSPKLPTTQSVCKTTLLIMFESVNLSNKFKLVCILVNKLVK